ncbi:MAG TPA: hypothetical protein VIF63_00375 [Candidatus Limnocylindrales bacterium]|jgi:hypothetical protein
MQNYVVRLVAASLVVVSVAACSTGAAPTATPALTAVPAFAIRAAAAQPQACMDALLGGKLTRNPGSGLGVTNGNEATVVEWPFRYSAREAEGRVLLIDETGKVVAREGDEITVGGGFGNQFWHACGPVTVTKAAN